MSANYEIHTTNKRALYLFALERTYKTYIWADADTFQEAYGDAIRFASAVPSPDRWQQVSGNTLYNVGIRTIDNGGLVPLGDDDKAIAE